MKLYLLSSWRESVCERVMKQLPKHSLIPWFLSHFVPADLWPLKCAHSFTIIFVHRLLTSLWRPLWILLCFIINWKTPHRSSKENIKSQSAVWVFYWLKKKHTSQSVFRVWKWNLPLKDVSTSCFCTTPTEPCVIFQRIILFSRSIFELKRKNIRSAPRRECIRLFGDVVLPWISSEESTVFPGSHLNQCDVSLPVSLCDTKIFTWCCFSALKCVAHFYFQHVLNH